MKNLIKYSDFISEGSKEKILLFYAFDFDDNILIMPTPIHLDKKEGDSWKPIIASTAEFAQVRGDKENYRLQNNDGDQAFCEFRDFGPRGPNAFLIDVKNAISQKRLGPAWNDFVECLTNGCVFAIITARGHESESMKEGVKYIIDNALSSDQQNEMYNNLLKFAYIFNSGEDYGRILRGKPSQSKLVQEYLNQCDFVGISSPSRGGNTENPEKAKEEALLEFHDKINRFAHNVGMKAKIGFSDDDLKNIKHIEDLYGNLHKERFPNIVQYTVKGTNPSGLTKKVRSLTETSNQAPGTESSVMSCTQFNNMTSKLYPQGPDQRQDDYANQFKRQTKYLTKTSKDILKPKKRKRRRLIDTNPLI